MNACLIVPAGGLGKRFGSALPKQFEIIGDYPIIIHTLKAFETISEISRIYIPVHSDWLDYLQKMLNDYPVNKDIRLLEGGEERQDSVYNALLMPEIDDFDFILVHDAVRPFVSENLILKLLETALISGSAVPFTVPKDTIRKENIDLTYSIIDRGKLRSIQTPQVFKTKLIKKAYDDAMNSNFYSTDDAALIEALGYQPTLILGEEINIKITTKTDKIIAESFLIEKKSY